MKMMIKNCISSKVLTTSGSSMNTCLTLSKVLVTTAETVKSSHRLNHLQEFASVSVDEVEITFSPVLKEPTTLIN